MQLPFEAVWVCGAAGSAPAWHAGGQGFESPQIHSVSCTQISAGCERLIERRSGSERDCLPPCTPGFPRQLRVEGELSGIMNRSKLVLASFLAVLALLVAGCTSNPASGPASSSSHPTDSWPAPASAAPIWVEDGGTRRMASGEVSGDSITTYDVADGDVAIEIAARFGVELDQLTDDSGERLGHLPWRSDSVHYRTIGAGESLLLWPPRDRQRTSEVLLGVRLPLANTCRGMPTKPLMSRCPIT